MRVAKRLIQYLNDWIIRALEVKVLLPDDLVVLDHSLFDMDRYKIWKVKPSAVVMEGKLNQGS